MRMVLAAFVAMVSLLLVSVDASAGDIQDFTAEEVMAILTEAGVSDVKRADQEDITQFTFNYKDLPYAFSLVLCNKDDKTKCAGLMMTIGGTVETDYSLDLINRFNLSVPFITCVKLGPKKLGFARFVIGLGGVTRDNVKANWAFLSTALDMFADVEKSQVIASVGTGGAQQLAQSRAQVSTIKPEALTPEEIARLLDRALIAKAKLPR